MTDDQSSQAVLPFPFVYPVPYMTRELYAQYVGLPIGVVDAWVERGHVPSEKIGKYLLVNIAAQWRDAVQKDTFR
ncbi:hypothetical protein [Methylococcus mesophilus]|uniref:hypothetical protein n=1 Tax=Methylococcus mesophilus TaxID=2993564 RepID=UPI00224AD85B|nr:hypothetical protein [Methylococcus mesophilus]UZR30203.1 hypothetical protein OOT43_06055 [Methylococcus mesophilus]